MTPLTAAEESYLRSRVADMGKVRWVASSEAQAWLGKCLARMGALEARVAELEAALRQVEWVWSGGTSDEASCPECGGDQPHHGDGCPLAAALAGGGDA